MWRKLSPPPIPLPFSTCLRRGRFTPRTRSRRPASERPRVCARSSPGSQSGRCFLTLFTRIHEHSRPSPPGPPVRRSHSPSRSSKTFFPALIIRTPKSGLSSPTMPTKPARTPNKPTLSKPLGGLPIVLKDNINALGHPCTCGSRFLENSYTAPYDATVTRKLREAGAVLVGSGQYGRIRDGFGHRKLGSRQNRQPARPHPNPGWLFGRFLSRGGFQNGLCLTRLRHRGLHSPTCCPLRYRRA